jgi:hypothetical protein
MDMTLIPRINSAGGNTIGALLLLAVVVWPTATIADPEEKGRAVAQAVYDRPMGADMTIRGRMILTEAGRDPRVRELLIYRKDQGDGNIATLVRFTAPTDIADTGLLTLDHADGSADQWVYLPALGQSRRIPSGRQGGRFVGSDLLFEDLQDRQVHRDTHRWLGVEIHEGIETDLLESVPVDPADSVYGKRVSWVHPDLSIPLRIDFYRPAAETPFKRFTLQRVELIQDYWTETDSVVEDLDSGHQTRLVSDLTVYDRDLPDVLFSLRALDDPSLERAHRPSGQASPSD